MLDQLKSLLTPNIDLSLKLTAVAGFLGKKVKDNETRILDLEARQLQKGDKGDKGDPGAQGKDGRDGKDGAKGVDGRPGRDGKDGKDGKPGKHGVSVVAVDIAADEHLIVTLSDGMVIDAGELPKAESETRVFSASNGWQIVTSDTPPSNPSPNDLWLATNLRSACG